MARKKTIFAVIVLILVGLVLISAFIKIPYTVKGKGIVTAKSEFSLMRTIDGNLVSSHKDNIRNTVNSFDVTEFQRGDVVSFRLNQELVDERYVNLGDTLGFIVSNEEQRNLIDLKGQVDILRAELEFFTTGQKPEDVLLAKEAWDLAKQELKTRELLMARTRNLIKDGVISQQEFEIEENMLMVASLQEKIAEANYLSVTTGEKPEQEKLVRARMSALQMQIDQIQSRISYFTITSPMSGKLYFPRVPTLEGTILTVVDTSALVGVVPILYAEYNYIAPGQKAQSGALEGKVQEVEDMIRLVDFRQAFYVTTVWPYTSDIRQGSLMEVKLSCDSVSVLDFFWRRFSNNALARV